jgi:tetratricopeptide (TPR) repeat protein
VTASNVQKTAAWKAPAKTVPDNPAPAVDSSLVTGRTIRESMLSGATIRDNRGAAGQPAANTAPPDALVTGRTIRESMLSGRTLRKSLVAGDTIPETPAVTAAHVTGRPAPASPSAETARAATLKAAPAVASPAAAPESGGYSMGRPAESHTAEFDFSKVPTGQTETWSRGKTQPIRKDPAWTRSGTPTSTTTVDRDDLDLDDSPRRRRGLVTAIVVAAVLLVGGGIAWLLISKGDLLQSQLGEAQDQKNEEREKLLLLDAREKFLLDTPTDFALAEKKYLQVLSISRDNAQAMAELALMYAVRAQYTLDELVDAQVDRKDTEALQSRFESQVEEARRYATGAIDLAPRLPDAHLAMADADRLSGAIDSARGHVRKARSDSTLTEAACVDALISIADRGDRAEIIGMLKSSIANPPLLRSLYRLARVQASAGRMADAKSTLSELFHVNANHPQGRRLKERLDSGRRVELLPGAAAAPPAAVPVAVEPAVAPDVPAEPVAGTPAGTPAPTTAGTTATAAPAGTDGLLEKAAKAQDSGKYQDALTLYGQVLDKEPSNLDALTGMAATYMEMNNWGQAIAKFKKALGVNSRFGPALIGIAQTYKSMGQPLVALSWFEKYLEANPSGRDAEIARRNIDALRAENAVSGGSPDAGSPSAEEPSDAAPESPEPSETPTPPTSAPEPDAQPVE